MNHRAAPLSEELERSARWQGDETAIRELDSGRVLTYEQLNDRANAIANALHDRGVRQKDRVAIVCYNMVEFPETLYACHKRGFIPVAVNGRFSRDTFSYVFEQLNPAAVVFDEDHEGVASAAAAAPFRPELIVTGDGGGVGVGDASEEADATVETLRENGATDTPPKPLVVEHEVSYMFYTSGTTGRPKAAAHSIRSARQRIERGIETSGVSSGSVLLILLPLFHGGGLDVTLRPAIATGAELLLGKNIDDETALEAIEAHDVTDVRSVATQMRRFAARDDINEWDFSSIEAWRHTGGVLTESDARTFAEKLTPNVFNAYGSSEGGTNTILRPSDLPEYAGTVGRPTVGDEVRVVERDVDREVSPSETVPDGTLGEVIVRSEQMYSGYYEHGDPRSTQGPEDWYYTNDLGVVEDGYLRIEGRADDMIVSGGELISAAEVEDVLESHPAVTACVVVGVPDEEWGQQVKAYVEATTVDAETLETYCKGSESLADYKRPRQYEFVEQIRLNEVGKKTREYYR